MSMDSDYHTVLYATFSEGKRHSADSNGMTCSFAACYGVLALWDSCCRCVLSDFC